MKFTSFFIVLILLSAVITDVAFSEEEGALRDTPYFSAMPGYYVGEAADKEFDAYSFPDGKKNVRVEGRLWRKQYWLKENGRQASDLQIIRNYSNAIKAIGGKVLLEGTCSDCEASGCSGNIVTGKATKGTKELWITLYPCNDGSDYTLVIIEKEAMKQDVTANDMLSALNSEGHIALHINFDTGKSVIKEESLPVIGEIVTLMKNNPDISLTIEGHTDNTGDAKSNRALSENRARSVVNALADRGIETQRLSSAGFGQEKPVADNKTEEGRAKNRRVELVKK